MSDIRQKLFSNYPGASRELVFLEPDYFDEAIIGVAQNAAGLFAVAYSEPTILRLLQKHEDMDADEAVEWYSFNTAQAYIGEGSPLFVDDEISSVD